MQSIEDFFQSHVVLKKEVIAQAGSDRAYTRLYTSQGNFIHCESSNRKENNTFIYFTQAFNALQLPVPQLLACSEDRLQYIQTDGGTSDLLQTTQLLGFTEELKQLYQQALRALCTLQVQGDAHLDYEHCFASKEFDVYAVQADLNYFKYYFLDLLSVTYNKVALQHEFERWGQACAAIKPRHFMYRDFQGRNILVNHHVLTFIDYQGGMKGPIHYDVASLLWQAKAKLPLDWKNNLLNYYIDQLTQYMPVDRDTFNADYAKIVLTRLLQVLGAYGLRGLIEKRPHFVSSIPFGLEHIQQWMHEYTLNDYPELQHVLTILSSPKIMERFQAV